MARLSSELVLSLTDRVSGPARGVDRALDHLEKRQRALGRQARLTADDAVGMGRTQSLMLAGASRVLAPVAGAFSAGQVISSAADFEAAMTGIQKKAGTSAEETTRLGEEIKALSTSGELAVPIEEILGAYERGAAAGIPINELKQFAALSVKAADAFEMPAEQVGNFASKLKTSMGLSETAIKRVFDLTNSLADSGISDEKDIVDFVDRTGASLKTLGLNMDQTLSLGSTLLNLGMGSEVASTAMDALSTKMLTASTLTGQSRKTFEKYMGPIKNFSKAVRKDANGALLQMLDRIKGLNAEQRMEFLSSFVGQDHAGKILRLAEATDEYRRNLALAADEEKWHNSLDKAYQLKLDDFWSQWQLVKNAFRELTIDAGTMGLPALKQGLDGLRTLIGEIGQGLQSLEAKIDWSDVEGAKAAVGDLGRDLSNLLQMDTEGSTLGAFFKDLAGLINETTEAVKAAATEAKDIVAFVKDPLGYMRDEERMKATGERWGLPEYQRKQRETDSDLRLPEWLGGEPAPPPSPERQAVLDREAADREARTRSKNPIEALQARIETAAVGGAAPPVSLSTSADAQSAASSSTAPQTAPPAPVPAATVAAADPKAAPPPPFTSPPQGARRGPDPVRRAIGAAERVGEAQASVDQTNGLSKRYWRGQLDDAKQELADFSAGMPEAARQGLDAYAAEVAAGGGQVTEQARVIGEAIRAALSVTASPQVDTSQLDALIAKINQAKQGLSELGAASARAAASASQEAAHYDDVNADIED